MNAPFRGLAAIEVVGAGRRVPLLDGSTVPYVNLDNAASTPALRPVADAVTGFLDQYSSVHRGSGYKSRVSRRRATPCGASSAATPATTS